MKVFKFGGASVKDATGVRNMARILGKTTDRPLLVVVSAMGKTTNALERLLSLALDKASTDEAFDRLQAFHMQTVSELFPDPQHRVYSGLNSLFAGLKQALAVLIDGDYDAHYDTIVPYGELISSCIVHHFLQQHGMAVTLIDAREFIHTDAHYRAANVDWEKTASACSLLESETYRKGIILTQGFIGRSDNGHTTSLGREGSDFTAAIFAYCLNASEVVIWKDVPGLLNADPKRFARAVKLVQISYTEAIELAYYGATVIHPKTIKPLQNKNIVLKVQSFLQPESAPTLITAEPDFDPLIPSIIVKDEQVLISISPRDFSFMNEANLHVLFGILDALHISVNVMQTSAISLSLCVDRNDEKLALLLRAVQEKFKLRYNTGLSLLTLRHYSQALIDELSQGQEVLLEQRSRITTQLVMRKQPSDQ
ncbi:MAG: aspartate kinase [Bacteroidales bacterium]|nr:aspartate kinase [Bacteroidales bacterium]